MTQTIIEQDRARQAPTFKVKAAFAVGLTTLGLGIASIGYALGRVPDAGIRRPPIYPADWMFWSIWLVLYPTMGVAGAYLWADRHSPQGRFGWYAFVAGMLVNFTWVPTVHLSHSPVAGPAVMDAVTGVAILPASWAMALRNRFAFRWFLPMQVWGPITGVLKIWQLLLNRTLFPSAVWKLVEWSIYAGCFAIAFQLGLSGIGLWRSLKTVDLP